MAAAVAAVALAGIVAAADTAAALAPANGTQLGTGFAARPNTPAKGAHEVAVMIDDVVTRARAMPDNGQRGVEDAGGRAP